MLYLWTENRKQKGLQFYSLKHMAQVNVAACHLTLATHESRADMSSCTLAVLLMLLSTVPVACRERRLNLSPHLFPTPQIICPEDSVTVDILAVEVKTARSLPHSMSMMVARTLRSLFRHNDELNHTLQGNYPETGGEWICSFDDFVLQKELKADTP